MTPGPATIAPPTALRVGVLRESTTGERRVALTPDGVTRLCKIGLTVTVEAGAGAEACYPDEAYVAAGAGIAANQQIYADSDLLLCVQPPDAAGVASMHPGQALMGLLAPLIDPELVRSLTDAKVTAISLDGLPRTLSSAQSMDALTSQANVAGYKATLIAANAYGSYFPMLMTAAGTVRPAKVLVLGAGVAGLQAIGTARRLGAVVTAYDVREAARGDIASTGATFLDLHQPKAPRPTESDGAVSDGYARELSAVEQHDQAAAMVKAIGSFDVVITTAQVPGHRPPLLVTTAAVAAMRPGSVIVDLGAGPLGGNVEGSRPDDTVTSGNGVTIIGAGHLPSSVPMAASTAYSRNVAALLTHLVHDGRLELDTADEVTAGVVMTRDGAIVHPAVAACSPLVTAGQDH